jgi:hypothetical protein
MHAASKADPPAWRSVPHPSIVSLFRPFLVLPGDRPLSDQYLKWGMDVMH